VLPIKLWLRFLLLINSIGGGCIGLSAIGSMASNAELTFGNLVLFGVFIALFSFGVFAGLLLSVPSASRIGLIRAYLLLQIPILSSPYFGYQFISGSAFQFPLGRLDREWIHNSHSAGRRFSEVLVGFPFSKGHLSAVVLTSSQ